MASIAVVGGGIAGLVAARDLHVLGHEVTVLESTGVVGGKLRSAEVAGQRVDVGAEAVLNRRPEAVALMRELGLEVVHPAVASSRIYRRGQLRPMPRTLLGVPLDLDELAASNLLTDAGLQRARAERLDPAPEAMPGDISVGELIARRLGDEVTDTLVEPLLGGVYAGHAREISARAAAPQVLARAARGPLLGVETPASDVPVFAGLPGGMATLPAAIAAELGPRVRTHATVRELRATGVGFTLTVGPSTHPEHLSVDHVIVAAPPAASAKLLHEVAPLAAAELSAIETASVAVVTLAFPRSALAQLGADSSGFLVPPQEGMRIKASTYSCNKWAWVGDLDPDLIWLRTSLGRHRQEFTLQAEDRELVRDSLADLHSIAGLSVPPVDAHVQRWGGGLPQYSLGHLDRITRIRAAVARVPGLAVCGATYDGVGVPAVVGSAHRAVVATGLAG